MERERFRVDKMERDSEWIRWRERFRENKMERDIQSG